MKPWSRLAPMQAPPKHTNKSPGLCLCHTASSCCNAADPVPVTFHPAPLDPLALHSSCMSFSPKSECNHQRRNNHATSQHQRQVSPELTADPAVCTGCTALCASAHNSWRSGGSWGGGGEKRARCCGRGASLQHGPTRCERMSCGQIPPQGLGCFGPQVARRTGEKT